MSDAVRIPIAIARDHVIDTPEESDFFEAIGWPDYPEPGARCFV